MTAALTTFSAGVALSAGDLAYTGSTLYESGIAGDLNNELINLTTGTAVGELHVGTTSGADVFGLANDGTTTFAVAAPSTSATPS